MADPHLLYLSAYVRRSDRYRFPRAEFPSESVFRRLRAVVGGWRRQPPLPYLNDHLCRDIGIEPGPKRQEWFWPW